jgi:hypothetical protein
VTFSDSEGHRLYLQDDTGGIKLDVSNFASVAPHGEVVEVTATTGRGDRHPVLLDPELKSIDSATLLSPRPISPRELRKGGQDDNWVELEGIVRGATSQNDGRLRLDLASAQGPFSAHVQVDEGIVFSSIVDASVRLRGVAHSTYGARGELGPRPASFFRVCPATSRRSSPTW